MGVRRVFVGLDAVGLFFAGVHFRGGSFIFGSLVGVHLRSVPLCSAGCYSVVPFSLLDWRLFLVGHVPSFVWRTLVVLGWLICSFFGVGPHSWSSLHASG
ncbi:hypothetical protein ATANTOWER_001088 [Ataeniobius toweri]|uniref:Transmembrane protein n=1 Tax=Ataeniobius toweri TaxID=208326 RepID=A0ABU7BFW2_9TELE|nr:hypothetical protein [Ataeniobius toweri]